MKWIDSEKRLPPNNRNVIVAVWDGRSNVKMYAVYILNRLNRIWFDMDTGEKLDPKFGVVTHWMALPDDPDKMKLVEEERTVFILEGKGKRFKEVLFDFAKQMPHGVINDNLTVKELEDIIDNFMDAHTSTTKEESNGSILNEKSCTRCDC
ncbi:hypothetical protein LCGC14_1290600 [marine sediment metagenome]|uniref:DUF551 domain-containing protein n=1 Tax=marine sediment metagenome TaxID=412755 RepID=A0A0F9KSQ6_9ZZZZ